MSEWEKQGKDVSVSVNLSARDLIDESIVNYTALCIREAGIQPRHLEFELTERSMIEDEEKTFSILILKGVLSFNALIFIAIKVLGCLYIAYLGYDILKVFCVMRRKKRGGMFLLQKGACSVVFWWVFPILKILFSFPLFSHNLVRSIHI